jgi:PAS domain S-box-containing protein
MMAAGMKKPEVKNTNRSGIKHSMREDAEVQLTHFSKPSSAITGQLPETLIYELQVHQIELEMQAEELRNLNIALEESRDKYLDLYDFAPVGYFTLNDKALISEANLTGATLLGLERGRLLKERFSKFVSEKDADKWHLYFIDLLNQKEKQSCTLTLAQQNGTMFSAQLDGIQITGSDGIIAIRIAIIDTNKSKQTEDALRLANKKLHLISGITRHDLKNQILSLNGYLGISKNYLNDPVKMSEYITKEEKITQTMERQIDFTKEYETIGIKIPIWQDCRALVETATKQVPLQKCIIKNDLPAGTEVFADPMIIKVFYNLLDNAVQYGSKITKIRFAIEESGDDIIIVCDDDGVGITVDEKEKIFERGFGKNTGMGLFLACEILDITGITIRETGDPGKGARFEIKIPKGIWRIK